MRGTTAVFEAAPAPATITLRFFASSMFFTGLVNQVAQTFCSFPMEPIQPNLRGSYRAPGFANSGSRVDTLASAAIVRASLSTLL